MTDISLVMGGDLSLGSSGDLATTSGDAETEQRVIRRLLTNVGAYLWSLTYGAGLPGFVGTTVSADTIAGVIRAQMALEASVLESPAPTVSMSQDATGDITANVTYYTAAGKQTALVSTSASGIVDVTWTNWNPDVDPLT